MKRFLRRMTAIFLTVGLLAMIPVFASAETVDGCSIAPDAPGTISLGTAALDESEDFTVLAEMTVRIVVQMNAEDLPEAARARATASGTVNVPLAATITVAQKKGSTKLTTSVTVRPENLMYNPLIRSVGVSLKYVNCTEFTIPDSGDGFTIRTSNPTNYLSGTHDSNQSFITGHTIATTVTITSVKMDNGTWSGGPVSASRQVTIR